MLYTLAGLTALLIITQAATIAAFLHATDRLQARHASLTAAIEQARAAERQAWAEERRELNQRLQAPNEATVQYAPYEAPTGLLHVPINDDEAFAADREDPLNG